MSKQAQATEVEQTMAVVMEMMGRLDALLKQENEALRVMDRKKFLDLQQEKVTLAKNYEQEAQKLIELRGNIGKANETLKADLKSKHSEFTESADENLKVLLRRRDGAKRLNARIVDAARDVLVKKEERYDSSGYIRGSQKNKSATSGMVDTV